MAKTSDKYKQLFEYSNAAFNREYERFKILEQKATQYLSILTLLIGIAGFFVKWVVDNFIPPRNFWEWILVILTGLIFATLAAGWFRAFSVIRVFTLLTPPMDQALIDFFVAENEDYIYYDRASKMAVALAENRKTMSSKTQKLVSAYKCICAGVVLLILFSIAFAAYNWRVEPSRDKHMAEPKETNPTPAPSNPEPSSQPSGNVPQPSSDVPSPPFGKVEYGEKIPEVRDPPGPNFIIKEG
ncbi:MAG: hypothetical protein ABL958_20805 [Bdellovibrionia bacterium]